MVGASGKSSLRELSLSNVAQFLLVIGFVLFYLLSYHIVSQRTPDLSLVVASVFEPLTVL